MDLLMLFYTKTRNNTFKNLPRTLNYKWGMQ